MSHASVILNGVNTIEEKDFSDDGNINMGAAINDNSCSKHLESLNSKESKAGTIPYCGDFDHLYATNMSEHENVPDKNTEVVNLKELLLLHLDLIQQQSEQLVTKDKQISALKKENEMLIQRLERMDRRVTLKKQKELSDVLTTPNSLSIAPEVQPAQTSFAEAIAANASSEDSQQVKVSTAPEAAPDATPNHVSARRRKREEKLGSSSCSVASGTCPKRRNRSLSWTSSVMSAEATPAAKTNGGKTLKRERSARRERSRKKRSKKEGCSEKKDESIIMTECPYYTPVGDADNIWNVDETPVNGCVLEVPSWRVKVFTSCYTMEGTENLSDDVFDRRHSRLEIDERRRKRWDVQRIREQRQLEKLRQGGRKRSGGGGGEGDDGGGEEIESLWPAAEDVRYLQVQDVLPVAAFGCPISKFDPPDAEFSLPWVNGKDSSRGDDTCTPKKKR